MSERGNTPLGDDIGSWDFELPPKRTLPWLNKANTKQPGRLGDSPSLPLSAQSGSYANSRAPVLAKDELSHGLVRKKFIVAPTLPARQVDQSRDTFSQPVRGRESEDRSNQAIVKNGHGKSDEQLEGRFVSYEKRLLALENQVIEYRQESLQQRNLIKVLQEQVAPSKMCSYDTPARHVDSATRDLLDDSDSEPIFIRQCKRQSGNTSAIDPAISPPRHAVEESPGAALFRSAGFECQHSTTNICAANQAVVFGRLKLQELSFLLSLIRRPAIDKFDGCFVLFPLTKVPQNDPTHVMTLFETLQVGHKERIALMQGKHHMTVACPSHGFTELHWHYHKHLLAGSSPLEVTIDMLNNRHGYDVSHLCHHGICDNPRCLVFESSGKNQSRNRCLISALDARADGRAFPEFCNEHNPPCKLWRAALTTTEILVSQFIVHHDIPDMQSIPDELMRDVLHADLPRIPRWRYPQFLVFMDINKVKFDAPFQGDVDHAIQQVERSLPWTRAYSRRPSNPARRIGWPKLLEYHGRAEDHDLPDIQWNGGRDYRCHLSPCSSTRVRTMSEFCRHLIKDHPDLTDAKRADLTWEMVIKEKQHVSRTIERLAMNRKFSGVFLTRLLGILRSDEYPTVDDCDPSTDINKGLVAGSANFKRYRSRRRAAQREGRSGRLNGKEKDARETDTSSASDDSGVEDADQVLESQYPCKRFPHGQYSRYKQRIYTNGFDEHSYTDDENHASIASKGKVAEKNMKLGLSGVPQSPNLSGNSRDAKRMRMENDTTCREEPKRPRAAPQRQASGQNKITDYLLH